MTRFVIDAPTAVRLIQEGAAIGADHQLVAPSTLRSQVLELLYRQHGGAPIKGEVAQQLDRLSELKIRLLGDRVSRSTAWKLAAELGWSEIGPAEYLAVAKLQADALVTDDDRLRSAAEGIVRLASFDELLH
jgi:predicted nucleic acid-binding protein